MERLTGDSNKEPHGLRMHRSFNHGSHSHGHTVGLREESRTRVVTVIVLTTVYLVLEVVAAVYSGSLALLADAGHMISDVGSLMLTLFAFWFSTRPATQEKTFGYYRSEILAGLINGVVLVGISGFVMFEAYRRLFNPPEVMSLPMLVVAVIGLVVNLTSMRLLGKSAEHSLNMKAAYLEVLSDLMATIGVIAAAVVIMFTRWYMADPIISGLIGLMILPRTWLLLSDCTNILMEGAPGHVNLDQLRQSMLGVPGVLDVHDIHVWTITSGLDAMSGHVTMEKESAAEAVLGEITRIAQEDFGLHHTTVQVESIDCKSSGRSPCGS